MYKELVAFIAIPKGDIFPAAYCKLNGRVSAPPKDSYGYH